jgi:phosphoribosylformimino-5-aminoimidazole carboxamide ribotide isomerase
MENPSPTNSSPEFVVYPAIDLRKGQVVRLKEGDPDRQTSYSSDPAAAARRWMAAGATWLHVVNLDGAFDQADTANRAALAAILAAAASLGVRVQFGGGLRSLRAVEQALASGVGRAILGTLAVEKPQILEEALARWGSRRVGASLDARDGMVQVRGWQQASAVTALEAAVRLKAAGLEYLVYTDIARDGLQTGLNLAATIGLASATGLKVIASGGVRGAEDIHAARSAGLAGAIAGRALYEGTLRLEDVL